MSSITLNSITPEKSRTLEVIAPGENTIIIRRIMESIKNAGFKILQDEKRTMSGEKGTISHFVSGYKYKTGWIEISSTIQSQTGNTCKVVSTIGIKPYKRKQIKSEEKYREKMFEYIRDGLMGKESVDPYIKADQQMFVVKVYGWMVLALCLSGLTALWAGSSEQIMRIIVLNKVLFYSILGAQLLLVVGLAFFINDIPPPGIALLFIIYSILTGLSLSIIFMLYTKESIVMTFFISAGIFAVMSIYGFFTKTDLTKLGNVLFLSLIDILIASF
ncbi:MAG: Bax inhibitor-1 family protein, partial [Spirochaetales bacterium]|nr:Bax inhibitor-1 family protein [Spirochaetales bacterium]